MAQRTVNPRRPSSASQLATLEPPTPSVPLPGFAEFGVSQPVVDALKMRGITGAFAIQQLVLRDAIAGRDVLARSRTGSGKTLAFAIPIVERLTPSGGSPTALILAPTRELASQVTEDFRAIADVRHLHVAAVYGGVAIGPQAKRSRGADIVIATPGRLLDLVARRLLRLDRVRICVLDEADRMLDMGFLPDVKRILEMLRPDRQTMLFSATLDGEVGRLAARFTHDPVKHEVNDDDGVLVALADHRFVAVEQSRKSQALVRELAADRGLTLIFVRTQRGADRLAKNLKTQGFRAGALHGGMAQNARERALGHFASGAQRRARRDGCRRARSGPRAHHARDQLRSAGGREGLRAPRRAHRSRGAQRHGDHVRDAGEALGRRQDRQGARAARGVRRGGAADGRAATRGQRQPEATGEREPPPALTKSGPPGPDLRCQSADAQAGPRSQVWVRRLTYLTCGFVVSPLTSGCATRRRSVRPMTHG